MRLWSLHPSYLDAKGLVALWREALLAKHVLEGKTKGYTNHPQLNRFKAQKNPVDAIHQYLAEVQQEAERRGYRFDKSKIKEAFIKQKISVTDGQVAYEKKHLLKKLKERDKEQYLVFKKVETAITFSMFRVVGGDIEEWEIV